MKKLIFYLYTLNILIIKVRSQQQYFRVRPRNIEVSQGGTGIIPCEVGNRAGRVQWTRDGLTLGYDRSIPGIPRYEILGVENSGQFSLQITNVTLVDDADFECQVGPASYNKPIRASSVLSVLLPPTSIEIIGHPQGSKIEIRENEEIELQCRVSNAKPKAMIRWYRKGNRFNSESETISEEEGQDSEGEKTSGRKTVTSAIRFRPTSADNGAIFACEAEHPALISKSPMRVTVVLSVMYPSGPPEIEGYIQGETIRMGQTVSLICVSHGGNPLAEVVWYRGDEQIDFSYYTTGRESRNMYTFVASSEDNNKRYRCKAKNTVSVEPLTADIVLSVQFAPDKVTIEGPTEANVGDTLSFDCITTNSNPPAIVQWVVDSRSAQENFTVRTESERGGWETRSNISVLIGPNDRNKIISCYAINNDLGETVVQTHTISVLYPPGKPSITGIDPGTIMDEGQSRRLTCISMAGNPLATLTWYRGDEIIQGTTQDDDETETKNYAQSELHLTANYSDNGMVYRCEASNPATAQESGPLSSTITLSVRFKPITIAVKSDPEVPKAGKKAYLFCETGSSNPTANVIWRRNDGLSIENQGEIRVRSGPFGGNLTTNVLGIDVEARDHGVTFICEATNEELGESVNDGITMTVKYKPIFDIEPTDTIFSVEEGSDLVVNISVRANPFDVTYRWANPYNENIPNITLDSDNIPRIYSIQNLLNITEARKEDAGRYKFKVNNSEGKSRLKIKIDVLYGATISDITDAVMVVTGETAHFECVVDAKPITADTISWSRVGFDMEGRTSMQNGTNSMHLTVYNVSKEDAGEFLCTANNGIADMEDTKSTFLLVRQRPRIEESPANSKAASDKRKTAVLTCRAQGTPDVVFSWSRMGSVISQEPEEDESEEIEDEKYEIKYNVIDRMTWESELHIKNVSSRDYGSYDCIAQNEEGISRYAVYLNVTSRPDTPTLLNVFNYTYNSVYLTWIPGFDGGHKQSFIIRYRKKGSKTYQYVDVHHSSTNSFEVEDLKLGTKYSFSVKAFNDLGDSEFTSENVAVETLSYLEGMVKPEDKDVERTISQGIILTITLVSGLLLILNVILISCYVKRRRIIRMNGSSVAEGGSTNGSTKSATIEMYAGSSYNETMSGETLSSISEKSGSYTSSSVDPIHGHHHHIHHHPHPLPHNVPPSGGASTGAPKNNGGHNTHHHHTLPSSTSHNHHHHHQSNRRSHRREEESMIDKSVCSDHRHHHHHHHHLDQPTVMGAASTYLVDNPPSRASSNHLNYVTMPRRAPHPRQSSTPSEPLMVPRESSIEDQGRQAYIQSLGIDNDGDDVVGVGGGIYASTLDIESPIKKTYNGLYVPPADYEYSDSISLPPPPSRDSDYTRPHFGSLRHYSPETAGHLV
ncbi:nephrin [Lepeophtheirus salmonis]|uniref:nephrin n=1 Tax=Lepeophtheirus salmonis TaxID=72036 RepID=UPI003AF3BB18